ncbi:B-box-type zinc finger [Sesbania bispinosa]|nr:B-box-type zinc finger [Sesbania bispinosa]
MEMKKCELCKVPARTFCESDQASLCWDCDAKVHGANFLVARHSRTLLCDTCRSPTPWKASGARLGNTVSVCDRCAAEEEEVEESEGGNDDEMDTEDDDDFDSDVVDGDGDNQVVPWSSSTPPPPAASSSGSEWSSVSRRIRTVQHLNGGVVGVERGGGVWRRTTAEGVTEAVWESIRRRLMFGTRSFSTA